MHEEIGTSYIKLLESFTNDFGNINIDFDVIEEKDKATMINVLIKMLGIAGSQPVLLGITSAGALVLRRRDVEAIAQG